MLASGEVDALMLEYNLIQTHKPRFNIRYRDDKSYPVPRAHRGGDLAARPGAAGLPSARRCATSGPTRTRGPSATPSMRSPACSRSAPAPTRSSTSARGPKRPCLYFDIGRCAGPCVPEVSGVTEESYRAHVDAMADFLAGNPKQVLRRLETEMDEASERQEYEQAAKLRDQLGAARRAMESQEMVLTQPEDLDVIGHGRGRPRGGVPGVRRARRPRAGTQGLGRRSRRGAHRRGAAGGSIVRQLYMERDEIPPRVLVPGAPRRTNEVLEPWLSQRRGSRVRIGGARTRRQAQAHGGRHPQRRGGVPPAQAAPRLGLRGPIARPRRPRRAARPRAGAAAHRVLRHLQPGPHRHGRVHGGVRGRPAEAFGLSAVPDQGSGRTGRFRFHGGDAAPPVHPAAQGTGGRPQPGSTLLLPTRARRGRRRPRPAVSMASKVLADLGLQIPHVGLAKRLEEVYFPDHPEPLRIPRGSEALFVLQHLRDEAHRFAITYHRQKREKRALASPLDDIAGVGPGRKKALLKRFGSLDPRCGAAVVDEIAATPGHRARAGCARSTMRSIASAANARAWRAMPAGVARQAAGRVPEHARVQRPAAAAGGGSTAGPGFTLITGLSGAGRSEAAHSLEDLGFFVVDNLPPALLGKMAELVSRPGGPTRVAIVVDARGGVFFGELSKALDELQAGTRRLPHRLPRGRRRRPGESVRSHPAPAPAGARRPRGGRHPQGTAHDGEPARRRRSHHRHQRPHPARAARPHPRGVRRRSARGRAAGQRPVVRVQVRLARATPTWCSTCGSCPIPTGSTSFDRCPAPTPRVRDYVHGSSSTRPSSSGSQALLDVVVPGYVAEGKSYLTIAVGCTGGRHRSVVVSEELGAVPVAVAGCRSASATATSSASG